MFSCKTIEVQGVCQQRNSPDMQGITKYVFRTMDSSALFLNRSFKPYVYSVGDTALIKVSPRHLYTDRRATLFSKRKKIK